MTIKTAVRAAGLFSGAVFAAVFAPAYGHHGVASLGAVALEGPGAPVETTSSANLPQGSVLASMKLDYATFKTSTDARDDETDYNAFWLYGVGYGFTPWITGYVFLPYSSKVAEDSSFTTAGFGDVSLTATFGFKYDDGFKRVPRTESLDDWYDWHFSVFTGLTLPTGDANIRDVNGTIDPGKSLGFGKPSYTLGVAATRLLSDRMTLHLETSYLGFRQYRYDDGVNFQFGRELRLNVAAVYKLATNAAAKTRWDVALEANYLDLGRDQTEGEGEPATGGRMLYLQPGVRHYISNLSFALGVKVPAWTKLNEEDQQQGAEGRERYRLAFSASVLF